MIWSTISINLFSLNKKVAQVINDFDVNFQQKISGENDLISQLKNNIKSITNANLTPSAVNVLILNTVLKISAILNTVVCLQ